MTASEDDDGWMDEETVDALIDRLEAFLESDEEPEDADTVDDIREIINEAIELLETVDVSELPEIIDFDQLFEEVDITDPSEASPADLLQAADRQQLMDAVNITELISEGREFEDAVDDVTEEDTEFVGDDDGDMAPEGGLESFESEEVETALQDAMLEAVDKFREALFVAHEEIREFHEANQERFGSVADEQPDSLNPSAYSSLSRHHVGMVSTAKPSTIPRQARHSAVMNRRQIYGNRFHKEVDND